MPQISLSLRAQTDISRLHRFLVTLDPASAKRAVLAIRDAFSPLRDYPFLGRAVEDSEQLRELLIDFGNSGYIALYEYNEHADSVVILALKHQREDGYL